MIEEYNNDGNITDKKLLPSKPDQVIEINTGGAGLCNLSTDNSVIFNTVTNDKGINSFNAGSSNLLGTIDTEKVTQIIGKISGFDENNNTNNDNDNIE